MTTTEDTTYNGWTNYATWGVALVLDNEQDTYAYIRDRADMLRREAPDTTQVQDGIWTAEQAVSFGLADFLKDFTEELCGLGDELGLPEPSMMAQQIIGAGLAGVDWDEIANHVLSE